MLAYESLEGREVVWIALSDLFLDTDVSMFYQDVIDTCAAAPFSMEALHHILMYEVAPICYSNLLNIAGEWAGFDNDWLVDEISKYLQTQEAGFHQCKKTLLWQSYVNQHWGILSPKITALREYM